jgi:hypothetical protein
MILRDVVLGVILLTLILMIPTTLKSNGSIRLSNGLIETVVARNIVLLMFVALLARSIKFGVDSIGYLEIFDSFCSSQHIDEQNLGLHLSMILINAGMLGACNGSWITGAWAIVFISLLLCLPENLPTRLRFTALLLFSLIGIEFTTNALRQGLSIAVCVVSVAMWSKNKLVAIILAAVSILIHQSTAIILLYFALSTLGWRWFWPGLIIVVGAAIYSIQNNSNLMLLQPFLYEIEKYSVHDADEIGIRVLAFSFIASALVVPLLSAFRGYRINVLRSQPYTIALRLGLCSVPLLVLPYFGYRIIYGLYPLVLYFILLIGPYEGIRVGRLFTLLLSFNTLLLLTWAQGSTYMRQVLFFE